MITMAMQEVKHLPQNIIRKNIFSTACVAECYVCGKGLPDGYAITAKSLASGIVLFCNVHYPLE